MTCPLEMRLDAPSRLKAGPGSSGAGPERKNRKAETPRANPARTKPSINAKGIRTRAIRIRIGTTHPGMNEERMTILMKPASLNSEAFSNSGLLFSTSDFDLLSSGEFFTVKGGFEPGLTCR